MRWSGLITCSRAETAMPSKSEKTWGKRAQVSAKRINEVLETPQSVVDPETEKERKEKGTVEFKNVSFGYPGSSEMVISDISFRAEKGETVAFIGSTGSGKSTLINLIPRFFDATEGEVFVDGVNVNPYFENEEGLHWQKSIKNPN